MDLQKLAVMAPPFLLAIVLHEVMHGYAAYRLGDPTAKLLGRLTLNPIAHIDPMGSVIFPAILFISSGGSFAFGWAKPVPVNFFRLRNPKQDMIWVAAAGPLTNLALAAVSGMAYKLIAAAAPGIPSSAFTFVGFFAEMALFSVMFNMLLAVLNLIPVPPLDGGRILVGVLPQEQALMVSRIEPYGMFIVFGVLMLNLFGLRQAFWGVILFLSRTLLGM